MCDWCKGKGVPSHRPYNCRDRANRASRFYEAPSAEQDREDQKEKAAFGGDAFRSKRAKRAATPFTFTPVPLVSAFPPGGCSAVPFKPNF
jgi:hypothetical protein